MKPRVPARAIATLSVALAMLSIARPAFAGPDEAAALTVQTVMSEDYPGNLGPARKKLSDALSTCAAKKCGGPARAQIHVALGMVSSQLGQADEAKAAFANALTLDPNAKLPSAGLTPNIKSQWEEMKSKAAPPPPPPSEDPPKGQVPLTAKPTVGGGAATPAAAPDKPDEPSGDEPPTKLAPAWVKLAMEALQADQAGKLDECIEKDRASLKLEEQPRTRLHLASCESRAGKLVDALRDAQAALKVGLERKDVQLTKVATQRVRELLERIPHVTFVPPSNVEDLQVTFDDRPVPVESLSKKFSIDPGKHTIKAEGAGGNFEEEIDVKERELATVKIKLQTAVARGGSGKLTKGQIDCLLTAKTDEEVAKCIGEKQKNLVFRIGIDTSAYTDTNYVNVFSPGINFSVTSPTSGWNAGGHYILDVVSAASPDIISTASPPFYESRHAGGISGGYKPGLYGVQATSNVSREPDYLSLSAGIAGTAELNDKLITPRIAYSFSYDTVSRGPGNPLHDVTPYKGIFKNHEFDLGVTFVLSPTSIILVGMSMQFERGDQSKPYRYVPMFDPDNVAPFIPVGATVDLVNRTRLPVRPTEQLPNERDRFAVGARYNKRIGNGTFRIDERLYYDTWGTKASTTDSRYMVDLSKHLRVWPHMRLNLQSAASSFYQLAYSAVRDQQGILVPLFRTGDRELAPMVTVTAGGGTRIGLGAPEGEVQYGITIVGDVMYSRFFNSLFVTTRTGVYGTVAFDVEF